MTGSRPQHALLDPPAAQQRLAEGAAQEDAADPVAVLHVDRQVQAEPAFHGRAVDLAVAHRLDTGGHDVDDVAGDEADRQEHQHAQNEQRGDDQQQPPDDVGSHDPVTATRPLPPRVERGQHADSNRLRVAAQARLARLQLKPPLGVSLESRSDSLGQRRSRRLRSPFLASDPGRSRGGRGCFAHTGLCSTFHR